MKKTLFTLAVISVLVSCKKTETTPANSCSTSAASIAGTYKITGLKYKASAAAAEEDWYANWPDCQKDDTYELKADGSITVTDAGISCGMPPSPGSPTGWALESNNTVLRMSDVALNIVSFNCSALVVAESGISVAGDTKTTIYMKQ